MDNVSKPQKKVDWNKIFTILMAIGTMGKIGKDTYDEMQKGNSNSK